MADVVEKEGVLSRLFRKGKAAERRPAENPLVAIPAATVPAVPVPVNLPPIPPVGEVPDRLGLWLSDGRIVNSLQELAECIATMGDKAFDYHQSRGEFSDWVRDILKEEALAQQIGAVSKQGEVLGMLRKHRKVNFEKVRKAIREMQAAKKRKAARPAAATASRAAAASSEAPGPHAEKEKLLTPSQLRRLEKELLQRERELFRQEDLLNRRKLAISKERIQLLQQKAEMERQRLRLYIEGKLKLPRITLPPPVFTPDKVREVKEDMVRVSIDTVRRFMAEGRIEEALQAIEKAEGLIARAEMPDDAKRQLRYELLELQSEVKLATIKA